MPVWEGIEDASAIPNAVWLDKQPSETIWKPLRKSDCQALNASAQTTVHIEGGRRTADKEALEITSNFVKAEPRDLCSAIWFVREEKKETILHPLTDLSNSTKIEALYQSAVQATSSLGVGIDTLLKEVVVLDDGESKIQIHMAGNNTLTVRMVPAGSWFFSNTVVLQRGYGAYEIPGEDIENALGPVEHVIFVVHGIGEAFFSKKEINISGLIDQTEQARMAIHRKQVEAWKKSKSEKPPGRIEVIPIEWYDHIHDSSTSLMRSLQATTLQSIPALRSIANDVVFDVLMYLTPAFCKATLDAVTAQINDLYHKFQTIHPEFASSGGTWSLAGHSLGSVICWDLLCVLKEHRESSNNPTAGAKASHTGYQVYAETEHADKAGNGTYGPPVTMQACIPFVPEHTLFLGSPLGMFLTLRGAHPVFDELRTEDSLVSPFQLPTKALYNIFNPSDPVAYRIEPLLLPQDFDQDDVPPPMYLTVPGQNLRLHVKAKQLHNVVRNSLFNKKKSGWNSLIEGAVSVLAKEEQLAERESPAATVFALGGQSRRVDFSLQPQVIESEYINAVTAHSCYFASDDVLDFMIGTLTKSKEPVTVQAPEALSEDAGASRLPAPAYGY